MMISTTSTRVGEFSLYKQTFTNKVAVTRNLAAVLVVMLQTDI